jgi:hypothetical protein
MIAPRKKTLKNEIIVAKFLLIIFTDSLYIFSEFTPARSSLRLSRKKPQPVVNIVLA